MSIKYADNSIVSNPGSDLKVTYVPKVSPKGVVTLVQDGFTNVFDYIQSFRDSTNIETILARVARGELELLKKRPGIYGDFTKMPQTFAEMLQLQIDSNRLFDQLPVEIKGKFGNDPNQFFVQAGKEEWYKNLEAVLPDEVKASVFPKVESEVKENES